eukprot:3695-Heterococcus_DN1.PRE.3
MALRGATCRDWLGLNLMPANALLACFFCVTVPHAQQMSTVTAHWNQVKKRGAGMAVPVLPVTRYLFRYTMEIETIQYMDTTRRISIGLAAAGCPMLTACNEL